MRGYLKCAVFGCQNSEKLSTHRFPNPRSHWNLFQLWVDFCHDGKLKVMVSDDVYEKLRVCSKHFSPEYFTRSNRLVTTAKPTLHLPTQDVGDLPTTITDDAMSATASTSAIADESAMDVTDLAPAAVTSAYEYIRTFHSYTKASVRGQRGRLNLEMQARKEIRTLKKRVSFLHLHNKSLKQKLRVAIKFSRDAVFRSFSTKIDGLRKNFIQSQLGHMGKKPRARRYTLEDKILGLALMKSCGKGYRVLRSLFILPSKSTLINMLNRIPVEAGLCYTVLDVLKAEVKKFKNDKEKLCILMFDEMSLQPHLSWNPVRKTVDGFEDDGYRRTEKIANHVQVFMLRGLYRKWKQPIYYHFVHGAASKYTIVSILKMIVSECQKIGLRIAATVCDQGSNNVGAIKSLIEERRSDCLRKGTDTNDFVFCINNQEIVPLFDGPHLIKGLRNNLLKARAQFTIDGEVHVADWDHIVTAWKMDMTLGILRMMPKLNQQHVDPKMLKKMKVSYCTQVLSRSVAVAINILAQSGLSVPTPEGPLKLPVIAQGTAIFCKFCDDLFDSINGSSNFNIHGKILRTAVTNSSPHFGFWRKAKGVLQSLKYIEKKNETERFFIPPSVKNFIITLKNLKVLFDNVQKSGARFLRPRNVTQDPLENFFGQIRQRGGRFTNPTAAAFTPYFKSLLVSNLYYKNSMQANCESDDLEYLVTLQRFITQGLPEWEESRLVPVIEVPALLPQIEPLEENVLFYVAGYVIRQFYKKFGHCVNCKQNIIYENDMGERPETVFTRFKEYRGAKRFRLKYCCKSIFENFCQMYRITVYIVSIHLHEFFISDAILKEIDERVFFEFSNSCGHSDKVVTFIKKTFIRLFLFAYTKRINLILLGRDRRKITYSAPRHFKFAKTIFLNSYSRFRQNRK